jgi:ribosomal protein S10
MNRLIISLFLLSISSYTVVHTAVKDQSDLRKEMFKKHLSERVARLFIPAIDKEDIDQVRDAIVSLGDTVKIAVNIPIMVPVDGLNQYMFLLQYLVRSKVPQSDTSNAFVMKAISLLMNAGAELEIVDYIGNSLLHYAVIVRNKDLIAMFLSLNLHVDWMNDKWETPLSMAVKLGHVDIVEFLLKQGASSNRYDYEKRLPLHYACMFNEIFISTALVSRLLEHGTAQDVLARDRSGHTPADYAREHGYASVIAMFMAYLKPHQRGGLFSSFNIDKAKSHAPLLPDVCRLNNVTDEKITAARKNLRQVVTNRRIHSDENIMSLTNYEFGLPSLLV